MKIKFFRVITLILAFILMLNMFVACATSEERRKRRSSEIESDNSVKSAYELAVQNGFVGTMEEWLSSIIGNDKAQSDDKNTVETVKKYTVTFNWNCNDVSLVTKRITVKEGTILEMPTIPQRENATFLGWYTDVKCTKKFDFTTKITRSITLYAGWKLETYAEILEYQKAELEELKRLNNGELPEILLNEETYAPAFILGAYSDEKVNNFDSAIESLKDVENLMGFCNVEEEYVEISSFKFKDTVQYRMQQMHNGYVVYGQQLIVTTDENGGVTSLSGDYATIGYLFDPSINITVEEAIDVASEYSEFNSSEVTLVVYTLDGYNEMAYVLENEMYTVIVSAVDGMIIFECSEVMTELTVSEYDTVISTIGRNEEGDTFNTSYIDYADSTKQDNYVFYDKVRNIVYHDLEMAIEDDWGELVKKESLIDDDNIWTSNGSQKTIALSKNLSKTYDFYLEVLGLMSYDGNGGQSLAYVNDGSDSGKNAFNWGPDTFNGKIVTVLSFGGVANYQNNLDTVAHEYTHAVQNSLSSLK